MIDLGSLDAETRDVLARCGFETIPFAALAERLATHGVGSNRLPGPITLPDPGARR